MAAVKVSAKSDYAVRALLELAAAGEGRVKGEPVAQAQDVRSQRGAEGGYWLARAPDKVTVGEVIRAVPDRGTGRLVAPVGARRRGGSNDWH